MAVDSDARQSSGSRGHLQLRNGIWDHVEDGSVSHLGALVYIRLLSLADYETGICTTCSAVVAKKCNADKEQIKHVLGQLKKKKYINYATKHGQRGLYSVLIHKYEPTVGCHRGTRLNAWKHNGSAIPEYVPLTSSPVRPQSVPSPSPVEISVKDSRQKSYTNSISHQSPVSPQFVPSSSPVADTNKEEDRRLKIEDRTPPTPPYIPIAETARKPIQKTGGEESAFSLSRELGNYLNLHRGLAREIEGAILCAAAKHHTNNTEAMYYLLARATAHREAGGQVNQLWFRNADGWEQAGSPKQASKAEKITANNLRAYEHCIAEAGLSDADDSWGGFSAEPVHHSAKKLRGRIV